MGRYIDADLLIAEIERRKSEWKAISVNDDAENSAAKACFYEDENVLVLINHLLMQNLNSQMP